MMGWGKKIVGAFFALQLLFSINCSNTAKNDKPKNDARAASEKKIENKPEGKGSPPTDQKAGGGGGGDDWYTIFFSVKLNPIAPQDEVYLNDWRIRLSGVDDEGRVSTSTYFSMTGWDGFTAVSLPGNMFKESLRVTAYNNVLPFSDCEEEVVDDVTLCRRLQIFIPPYCHDMILWMIGPFEEALWHYYQRSAARHGEAWSPSQVDCFSWIAAMENLAFTEPIYDELFRLSQTKFGTFKQSALEEAFQENQQFLVPTRPPLCMAARIHEGGTMTGGESVALPFTLDDSLQDSDPIVIGTNGIVSDICGFPLTGSLAINNRIFTAEKSNLLDDRAFMGVISYQHDVVENFDTSVFNTRLGNGRNLDSSIYEDACALTSVVEIDNTNASRLDLEAGITGVSFFNLFGDGQNTEVYLTSNGNRVVDENDYWAIFYEAGSNPCEERVLAVELLGHRQGELADALTMAYDPTSENLFLGLRNGYEISSAGFPADTAFFSYTLHTWDASTVFLQKEMREQFAACYLAADVWSLQFFRLNESEFLNDVFGGNCLGCPLQYAEFAVRSQCFSNSLANQRWQTEDAGIFSINSNHNVGGDVIINPGWLAPHLDFEVYLQNFDSPVFNGPLTLRRTDESGQLLVELPNTIEGDRVVIKARDNCCKDYDLIVPCVPAFNGFAGIPGIPYLPGSPLPLDPSQIRKPNQLP